MLHKNILYPAFAEAIDIFQMLSSILGQRKYFSSIKMRHVTGVDIENKELVYEYEKAGVDIHNIQKVFEFIDWAMPRIKEVIDEGTAIFDFVESQLNIKEIGLVPFYKNEGYFMVPEHKAKEIHVYRFQLSNVITSEIPFKSLKTNLVESCQNKSVVY